MATEKRLIDVDALIEKIDYEHSVCNSGLIRGELECLRAWVNSKAITSRKVVHCVCKVKVPKNVVRCKDCRHYHADTLSCDFTPHGKYYERPNWYEDDFCSYGERKDNG